MLCMDLDNTVSVVWLHLSPAYIMLWLVAFLRKKKKVNYYKNDLITFLVTLHIILFPFLAATA